MRRAIEDVKAGRNGDSGEDSSVFGRQIREALQELAEARRSIDATRVDWSPETLHLMLESQLPDAEIIVVSNREPYSHNHAQGGIALQTPASGLVAAIEPVMRACGGVWIAHGSGSADRYLPPANHRIPVPPPSPPSTPPPVFL